MEGPSHLDKGCAQVLTGSGSWYFVLNTRYFIRTFATSKKQGHKQYDQRKKYNPGLWQKGVV